MCILHSPLVRSYLETKASFSSLLTKYREGNSLHSKIVTVMQL